jgi:ABC-type sugar transport system substrate-binding protein
MQPTHVLLVALSLVAGLVAAAPLVAAGPQCTDTVCCSTYEYPGPYFTKCVECVAGAPLTYWDVDTHSCNLR